MRIQRATDADADIDLVTGMRLAFLADHRGIRLDDLEPTFTRHTRAFVADRSRDGDLLSWLALDGDTPVGVVSMLLRAVPPRPDALATSEGYVINLFVASGHRRRGVGQLLLDAIFDHAAMHRFRRLVLHATDDGRPMYERAGFVRSDRWYELDLGS